jgi:hypothetical protein
MRDWPPLALTAVMTLRSLVQLSQEMVPLKDELPSIHTYRAIGPGAAELAAVEAIPAVPGLDPHGCQI